MLRRLNYLAVAAVFLALIYEYGAPFVARAAFGERYKDLMFQCDHAMRDHYIAKKTVEVQPSKNAIKNLEATELGLVTCHEYDKLRKKLQSFNVSDIALQQLGLSALEEREYDLQRFVKTHEFRY
jgi:hypothetical protein